MDKIKNLLPPATAAESSPHSRKIRVRGTNADFLSSGKSNCPNCSLQMCGLATASNINTMFKLRRGRGPSPSSDNEPWQLSN